MESPLGDGSGFPRTRVSARTAQLVGVAELGLLQLNRMLVRKRTDANLAKVNGMCERGSRLSPPKLSRRGMPRLRFSSLAVSSTGTGMDYGLYLSIRGIRAIRGLLIYLHDS
jgi:hypothetical protein